MSPATPQPSAPGIQADDATVAGVGASTAAASPAEPRTGPALLQAAKAFAVERPLRTWYLFVETLVVLGTCLAIAVAGPNWPAQVLAGILAGLVQVRLFIFYHDTMHGAIFRGSRLGRAVMEATGFYTMTVRSVWVETHDYHHQHNADMIGSSVGSYPILSLQMARNATPGQLRAYRLARHPLTIVGGYFTVFMIGMVVAPLRRNWRKHWQTPFAVVLHVALLAVAGWFGGWLVAVCAVLIPSVVAMTMGAYLFYAQHNFPAMHLKGRRDWDYVHAALRSSSMFEMSPVMHWFTGNIGYHHVHHLNHRIPFYRLPEAMRAIPETHDPGRTSWRLRDIRGCLRVFLWDGEKQRMLTRRESAAQLAAAPAA